MNVNRPWSHRRGRDRVFLSERRLDAATLKTIFGAGLRRYEACGEASAGIALNRPPVVHDEPSHCVAMLTAGRGISVAPFQGPSAEGEPWRWPKPIQVRRARRLHELGTTAKRLRYAIPIKRSTKRATA